MVAVTLNFAIIYNNYVFSQTVKFGVPVPFPKLER